MNENTQPKGHEFKLGSGDYYDDEMEAYSVELILGGSKWDGITTMAQLYDALGMGRDRFRRIVNSHGIRDDIIKNLNS
jgi:hypothetical protein